MVRLSQLLLRLTNKEKGGTLKGTLKAGVAAIVLAITTLVGGMAYAGNWQPGDHVDPAHTHPGGACTRREDGTNNSMCVRYILANGAVIQARYDYMISQYGYLLVYCSNLHRGSAFGEKIGNLWLTNPYPFGPWGNTGSHIYCQQPRYSPAYNDDTGLLDYSISKPWSRMG